MNPKGPAKPALSHQMKLITCIMFGIFLYRNTVGFVV